MEEKDTMLKVAQKVKELFLQLRPLYDYFNRFKA